MQLFTRGKENSIKIHLQEQLGSGCNLNSVGSGQFSLCRNSWVLLADNYISYSWQFPENKYLLKKRLCQVYTTWFKYGYVQTYSSINLFVFIHFIIKKENAYRLPTFARIGTQSECSNVTLNQIPRKFFSVHCFSDTVKVNISWFQL